MNHKIGIDSNCLTYIVDAVDPAYNPGEDNPHLDEERISILRLFLYNGLVYYVGPTVGEEYAKIKDSIKNQAHASFCDACLRDGPWELDIPLLNQRVYEFNLLHGGQKDCYVLAESEQMRLGLLLTNDNAFMRNLGMVSSIRIAKPSDYWISLGIPKGAEPKMRPEYSNPLRQKTWWKW